jgi:hypothetical protein
MCQVENAFVKHRHTLQGNVKDLNEELETEVKRLFRNNTSFATTPLSQQHLCQEALSIEHQ